jgi:general secretion pathway protein K
MPVQLDDLAWYGIDAKSLKLLQPFVQLLPPGAGVAQPTLTNINANTAPAEVLMAALPGISRARAQQIILARQTHPFSKLADVWGSLGLANTGYTPPQGDPPNQVDVKSFHFEIYGQLRLEQHVVRERSVVWRQNQFAPIQVLRRERLPPDAT